MAYTESPLHLSLDSSGDLSSHQYKIFDLSTSLQTELVATQGAVAVGILHDNTTQTNVSVQLQFAGVSPISAGGSTVAAINPGDLLIASTNGMAIPSTGTGNFVIAEAFEALSSGSTGVIAGKLIMSYRAT